MMVGGKVPRKPGCIGSRGPCQGPSKSSPVSFPILKDQFENRKPLSKGFVIQIGTPVSRPSRKAYMGLFGIKVSVNNWTPNSKFHKHVFLEIFLLRRFSPKIPKNRNGKLPCALQMVALSRPKLAVALFLIVVRWSLPGVLSYLKSSDICILKIETPTSIIQVLTGDSAFDRHVFGSPLQDHPHHLRGICAAPA
uniref:Uncharacterized protein n=1 Tax=Bionectria ochroleuca TaxID=29856 RepID=A0A8H7NQF6_BIOOC